MTDQSTLVDDETEDLWSEDMSAAREAHEDESIIVLVPTDDPTVEAGLCYEVVNWDTEAQRWDGEYRYIDGDEKYAATDPVAWHPMPDTPERILAKYRKAV